MPAQRLADDLDVGFLIIIGRLQLRQRATKARARC
jgi:hypothetical protein